MKPLMLARVAAVIIVVFLSGSIGHAAQGFKWWQSDLFKRELGLTAEQSKRLEEIFHAALPDLKARKKALDEAEVNLERLVQRGEDRAVMDQVDLVESARAELAKARTMMLLSMRKLLTTDQWAKFSALHQAAEHQQREREQGR